MGSKGTYRELIDCFNDNLEFGDKIVIKDLFSIISDVSEVYKLTYHESPNTFMAMKYIDKNYTS